MRLVCDAMREGAGTRIAFYNRGGIRGDLVRGPVRMWDIATVAPFKNKLLECEMTGAQVREFILAERPGVSGMRYRISGGRLVEATVDGKPLDDSERYTVAVTDFMLNTMMDGVAATRTVSDDYRSALRQYIRGKRVIAPVDDGRELVE